MATDYLAELQRDLSNRITRYLPTSITRRIDAAQDTTADPSPTDPSPADRHIPSSAFPLGARLPARGHVEDDWRARPTAERPWPVILIHGTGDTNGIWEKLALRTADGRVGGVRAGVRQPLHPARRGVGGTGRRLHRRGAHHHRGAAGGARRSLAGWGARPLLDARVRRRPEAYGTWCAWPPRTTGRRWAGCSPRCSPPVSPNR
ncbi:hypothetical protein QP028_06975 [Corynebacterium suedekumii]|nr:hypothetical protein QP028_06975 [Corynebacterium suedekumii]